MSDIAVTIEDDELPLLSCLVFFRKPDEVRTLTTGKLTLPLGPNAEQALEQLVASNLREGYAAVGFIQYTDGMRKVILTPYPESPLRNSKTMEVLLFVNERIQQALIKAFHEVLGDEVHETLGDIRPTVEVQHDRPVSGKTPSAANFFFRGLTSSSN